MNVRKTTALGIAMAAAAISLAGCGSDADTVSRNLSNEADNFGVQRRIVFYNGITDKYMLEIIGKCSIAPDTGAKKLDVTCKLDDGSFKKHFLGLSDNVTYLVEQIDPAIVGSDHYQVNFKPETIIPDIKKR